MILKKQKKHNDVRRDAIKLFYFFLLFFIPQHVVVYQLFAVIDHNMLCYSWYIMIHRWTLLDIIEHRWTISATLRKSAIPLIKTDRLKEALL